jgi:membrane protein implicated in regulation of membrane protease activity
MNLRLARLPLPIRFALLAVYTGSIVAATAAVIAGRNSGRLGGVALGQGRLWIIAVAVAIVVAALATLLAPRLATRNDPAEQARYYQAVASGQPSGDVSRWPEWIQRDFKTTNRSPIAGVIWGLVIGVQAIFTGPPWAAVVAFALAALSIWLFWRTRQQLQTLSENLTATTE